MNLIYVKEMQVTGMMGYQIFKVKLSINFINVLFVQKSDLKIFVI